MESRYVKLGTNKEKPWEHGNTGQFERERGNKDLPGRFFQGFDIELSHEIMFGFVNEIDTARKNLKIQEKIGPFGWPVYVEQTVSF